MNNSLIKEKLKNFNIQYTHPSYSLEQQLLQQIKLCHFDGAMDVVSTIRNIERPNLSKDPVRSLKNGLIASCTLFTRAAIESGVDYEDAFALSDVFIKHLDQLSTRDELLDFEVTMIRDFIDLINRDRVSEYQYPISKIVKYIYANGAKKLTVTSLAEMYHMSPDYLSKMFHQEVGVTLSHFIQSQRIEIAKNFIEFSDMSITDIANILEFCNPAYFTKIFKKHTGLSPKIYRNAAKNGSIQEL